MHNFHTRNDAQVQNVCDGYSKKHKQHLDMQVKTTQNIQLDIALDISRLPFFEQYFSKWEVDMNQLHSCKRQNVSTLIGGELNKNVLGCNGLWAGDVFFTLKSRPTLHSKPTGKCCHVRPLLSAMTCRKALKHYMIIKGS